MASSPHGTVPDRRPPDRRPVPSDTAPDPVGGQSAYQAASELLKALSAPTRVAIVTLLSTGPRCVHELVDALGVAQPLVSQHLRVLRAAGVVTARRRGREMVYRLADHHVGHIVADAVAHATE